MQTLNLVFYFVGIGGPFLKSLYCAGSVDMNARNVSFGRPAVYFFVNEFIGEIYLGGVFFCISIEDFFHACPIQRTQTHRARLTAAVNSPEV